MTIVPHDHRARVSGRQRVAGMTLVLGDPLFSSDFYCPLYPSVYRALLRAWQEYRTRWGRQPSIFHQGAADPSLSLIHRVQVFVWYLVQGAPGALVGEGWRVGARSTGIPTQAICFVLVCCPRPGDTANPVVLLGSARGCAKEGVLRCPGATPTGS